MLTKGLFRIASDWEKNPSNGKKAQQERKLDNWVFEMTSLFDEFLGLMWVFLLKFIVRSSTASQWLCDQIKNQLIGNKFI